MKEKNMEKIQATQELKNEKIKEIQKAGAESLFLAAIRERGIEDASVDVVSSTKAANTLLVNVNGNNVLFKAAANAKKWMGDVPKIIEILSDETKSSSEIFDALMQTTLQPIELPVRLAKNIKLRPNKDGKVRFFCPGTMLAVNYEDVKNLELAGMTGIDENAFFEQYKMKHPLESLIISDSVRRIGEAAFAYCKNLVSVTIADSVVDIGYRVFEGCESLRSVTLPKNLKKIDGLFSKCESLKSIDIPESVMEIDSGAFFYCNSLESVTIPEGVTEIGMHTFEHCISMKSIRIPKHVRKIGPCAFQNSSALCEFVFDGTVEQWKNMAKCMYWCDGVAAKTVKCNDGDAKI